jgi:phage shock protein PspC (stress-responsive transcriptional regulator)
MKKNISINISGIIFHIEEDGYENLKKYLDSINRYFSSFEDSSEILADIESRIAEIFLSKLNEEKQVITAEDVNALVATMGSVSDFKAAEEEDFQKAGASTNASTDSGARQEETSGGSSQSSGSSSSSSSSSQRTYVPPKSLSRDQKRKILGGVCSGIANYMNVDAVWIRLLFALLTFAYGFTFFVYIIMWIVVPGSYDLEEPEVEKKLFRDSDRKVIGGVAGGVAAYLGIDITLVRVLFVVFTIAGGLGFFIYVVMWVILPEARTLTDKMQMQGEPVTLSNIESNIKKNQGEQSTKEESTATKILMFPFRLIGMILSALAKILVPIIEVLRVAIGIVIVIFGMSAVFATIVAGGALLGVFSATSTLPWMEYKEMNLPVDAFLRAFPGWVAFAGFLSALAPSLMILLLGISIIAKRIVFSAMVGWSLFAMFFISSALLAVGIPRIVYGFKEDGESEITTNYPITSKRIYVNVHEVGLDDYHGAKLSIEGYNGKEIKLEQRFESQGATRQKAIENIQMINYHVEQKDSVFTFDSNVTFKEDAIFRDQKVYMTLFIPYGQEFQVDRNTHRLLDYGFNYDYYNGNTLKFTEQKGLECLSCPEEENQPITDLRDFDQVEITGKFDVRIVRGDEYKVELVGTEKEKERYETYLHGETLVIDYKENKNKNFKFENLRIDEVRITITMPSLDKLELTGYGTARFDEFTSDDLEIDVKGPVKIKGDINTERLSITMTGKAEADLSGRASKLTADIELASKLNAYGLEVYEAYVEARLASSAKVSVSGTLEMEELGASDIDYRGNPNIVRRNN